MKAFKSENLRILEKEISKFDIEEQISYIQQSETAEYYGVDQEEVDTLIAFLTEYLAWINNDYR